MTSEVKKTPKEIKNNKAPGIDNLTTNKILGGEESVKHFPKKSDLKDQKDIS